jgi:hypothetical protein
MTAMSDQDRQAFELRAILVSARAARRDTAGEDLEALRSRTHELLAKLEDRVLRDGGDVKILAGIEGARRGLWDD